MENESRFYVGFYCGFHSTQRTVGIESFYQTHIFLGNLLGSLCGCYKYNAKQKQHQISVNVLVQHSPAENR